MYPTDCGLNNVKLETQFNSDWTDEHLTTSEFLKYHLFGMKGDGDALFAELNVKNDCFKVCFLIPETDVCARHYLPSTMFLKY